MSTSTISSSTSQSSSSFLDNIPSSQVKVPSARSEGPPCVCLSGIAVRYTIIGLLCIGSFTTSISKAIMSSTVIAMAPQRSNATAASSLHHSFFQAPTDIKVAVPWIYSHSDRYSPLDSVCAADRETELRLGTLTGQNDTLNHPEFDWSEQKQNLLMGAFAIGYIVALLPSARISEYYGGRRLVTVGGAGHVLLNFASPWAARQSYWALVGCRVALGVSHASLVPSFMYMLTRWVPDDEKSKTVAALSVAGALGTIFLNLIAGYLCQNGPHGGWPSVFYLAGGVNLVWLVVWWLAAHDQPIDHPWITTNELHHIYQHTRTADRRRRIPPITLRIWFRLLLNRSVLSTIYVKLSLCWFFNMVSSKVSSYVISVLSLNLEQTSIYNTVYHTVILFSVIISGVLSDMAAKGKRCSKTTIRKSFESFATFGTALFMVLLTQTGCNQIFFIIILSLAMACAGASTGGSSTIIFDLTTNHAHTLVSMVSILTTLMSLITPTLVTLILSHNPEQLHHQWNVVFYVTAGICASGGLVFLLFGSASRLKWLDDPEKERQRRERAKRRKERRRKREMELETERERSRSSMAPKSTESRASTRTNREKPLLGDTTQLA